jgi:uncharacterized membrane protein YphA (DoxX/SURF4 family)
LEPITPLVIVESFLRIILGLRFVSSGLSNVRRWPNAARTASLVFPHGASFFGLVGVTLMVAGGFGVALGFQTPIAALMIIAFLIPTFGVHRHWLRTLPVMAADIKKTLTQEEAKNHFRIFERQSFHAHEVGIQDNLVMLVVALYFLVRGSVAFGLDNLAGAWVARLF